MDKLHHFQLVSKICNELDNHLGMSDKTLADFIIHLAKESNSLSKFQSKLNENGAEFPEALTSSLYRIITSLQKKGTGGDQVRAGQGKDSGDGFTGLRKPNAKPAHPLTEHLEMNDIAGITSEDVVLSVPQNHHGNEHRKRSFSPKERKTESSHSRRRRDDRRNSDQRSSDRRNSDRRRSRSRDADHRKRDRYSDDRDRHERRGGRDRREEQHDLPELYHIYTGRVTSMMDYGCFVEIQNLALNPKTNKKYEGLVHISAITSSKVGKVADVVRRGQQVKVKIISISSARLSLSMKDVNQSTGEDLMPLRSHEGKQHLLDQERSSSDQKWINPSAPGMMMANQRQNKNISQYEQDEEDQTQHRRRGKKLSSPERWEAQQLINSGVLSVEDYPTFDQDHGLLTMEETEEEFEVELNEAEPQFLRGQTKNSRELSPVRIIKNPDGSLQRAAMTQSSLAKERRELRQTQASQLIDSIPKDLNRPWEDPMPEAGERHFAQELRGINMGSTFEIPEWKQKAQGKNLSYGQVSSKSIKDQRETLPIFKLKQELMQAIVDNQVLVVIGETGLWSIYVSKDNGNTDSIRCM